MSAISSASTAARLTDSDVAALPVVAKCDLVPHDGQPFAAPATAGDHHSVHQFLMAVFQGPCRDAFLSTLDDPFYEPCDRLLIKHEGKILAHVHTTKRTVHFDGVDVPIGEVLWLGTLPESRGQGYARRLLGLAERRLAKEGAVLATLSTKVPHFFRPQGWAVCGRHSHSTAGARDVLAQLSASGSLTSGSLTVRPWRQVELPSVMYLHAQHAARSPGCLQRSEAFWRWMVSRKEFDQLFVVIDGPDRLEADGSGTKIAGYAVTRENRILELAADSTCRGAAEQLLARACGEAIERDIYAVTLHAPPHDPLHALFAASRGQWHYHEACQGEVFMARLLDPLGFLRLLRPVLQRRAEALPRPCELGLLVEGEKYRLALTRRGVRVQAGKLGRSYLSLNVAEFTRLALGHYDPEESAQAGRLQPSTRVALQTASALFPRLPLWRPPLDALIA